eukprot:gene23137-27997_t
MGGAVLMGVCSNLAHNASRRWLVHALVAREGVAGDKNGLGFMQLGGAWTWTIHLDGQRYGAQASVADAMSGAEVQSAVLRLQGLRTKHSSARMEPSERRTRRQAARQPSTGKSGLREGQTNMPNFSSWALIKDAMLPRRAIYVEGAAGEEGAKGPGGQSNWGAQRSRASAFFASTLSHLASKKKKVKHFASHAAAVEPSHMQVPRELMTEPSTGAVTPMLGASTDGLSMNPLGESPRSDLSLTPRIDLSREERETIRAERRRSRQCLAALPIVSEVPEVSPPSEVPEVSPPSEANGLMQHRLSKTNDAPAVALTPPAGAQVTHDQGITYQRRLKLVQDQLTAELAEPLAEKDTPHLLDDPDSDPPDRPHAHRGVGLADASGVKEAQQLPGAGPVTENTEGAPLVRWSRRQMSSMMNRVSRGTLGGRFSFTSGRFSLAFLTVRQEELLRLDSYELAEVLEINLARLQMCVPLSDLAQMVLYGEARGGAAKGVLLHIDGAVHLLRSDADADSAEVEGQEEAAVAAQGSRRRRRRRRQLLEEGASEGNRERRRQLVDLADEALGAHPLDSAYLERVARTVAGVVEEPREVGNHTSAVAQGILDELVSAAQDHGSAAGAGEAGRILLTDAAAGGVCAGLSYLAGAAALEGAASTQTAVVAAAVGTLERLGDALLLDMVTGQAAAEVAGSTLSISVRCDDVADPAAATFAGPVAAVPVTQGRRGGAPPPARVTFPRSLATALGNAGISAVDARLVTSLLASHTPNASEPDASRVDNGGWGSGAPGWGREGVNGSLPTSITGVSLLNSDAGEALEVSGLEEAIELALPLGNLPSAAGEDGAAHRPLGVACVYWDAAASAYRHEGCYTLPNPAPPLAGLRWATRNASAAGGSLARAWEVGNASYYLAGCTLEYGAAFEEYEGRDVGFRKYLGEGCVLADPRNAVDCWWQWQAQVTSHLAAHMILMTYWGSLAWVLLTYGKLLRQLEGEEGEDQVMRRWLVSWVAEQFGLEALKLMLVKGFVLNLAQRALLLVTQQSHLEQWHEGRVNKHLSQSHLDDDGGNLDEGANDGDVHDSGLALEL